MDQRICPCCLRVHGMTDGDAGGLATHPHLCPACHDVVVWDMIHGESALRTARRARLAEYAHTAWAGWMTYLFALSMGHADGSVTIPAPLVARWQRQIATAYADLPPDEQASDVGEADRILALL